MVTYDNSPFYRMEGISSVSIIKLMFQTPINYKLVGVIIYKLSYFIGYVKNGQIKLRRMHG